MLDEFRNQRLEAWVLRLKCVVDAENDYFHKDSLRANIVMHARARQQGGLNCSPIPHRSAGVVVASLGRPPERRGWPGDLALTRSQC